VGSPVDICNDALRRVGAATITSLDDNTTEAKVCKGAYEDERDTLLDEHNWVFATTRFSLARDVAEPDWGYSYAYTLPSTVIRVLSADDATLQGEMDWQREGGKILCDNAGPIHVRAIQRVEDATTFPPTFADALSYAIAAEICVPLTGNHSLYRDLLAVAEKKATEAANRDASQGRARFLTGPNLWKVR
jgi:hypothetical protein